MTDTVLCPFFNEQIDYGDCKQRRTKTNRPIDSREQQKLWDTCQTCEQNIEKKGKLSDKAIQITQLFDGLDEEQQDKVLDIIAKNLGIKRKH